MRRLIILLLILPSVLALNFGSLVKNDYVELDANKTAKFEIIVWSKDENYTIFLHEKNYPMDWLISIQPKIVSSQDEATAYINIGDSYVKAHRVNVFVNPLNAKPGNYTITLSASAYQLNDKINVIQERDFNLKVKILGNFTNASSSIIETEYSEKPSQPIKLENIENKKWIIAVIIAITAIIVFLILKY